MGSWLTDGDVQRLVVVVTGVDSGETLERWQFNVLVEDGDAKVSIVAGNDENISQNRVKNNLSGDGTKKKMGSKTVKEVHDEIQAIIRQITASVSGTTRGAHANFVSTHDQSALISSCRLNDLYRLLSCLY
jgi:mitotic spindle assembly checkpoint protein MAD2